MRVGFALGNIGPIGTAEHLVKIAQHAEALAYDSLWTVERLLWPMAPQTPYGATPDGALPAEYKRVLARACWTFPTTARSCWPAA
jgi:alkanesulfonate monooxygenase SsuD/methylene tetrahydromethanopterin reductase-like flavin-dependent oxidoreductase (luciferase family)